MEYNLGEKMEYKNILSHHKGGFELPNNCKLPSFLKEKKTSLMSPLSSRLNPFTITKNKENPALFLPSFFLSSFLVLSLFFFLFAHLPATPFAPFSP